MSKKLPRLRSYKVTYYNTRAHTRGVAYVISVSLTRATAYFKLTAPMTHEPLRIELDCFHDDDVYIDASIYE